jgi:hypothetical protein
MYLFTHACMYFYNVYTGNTNTKAYLHTRLHAQINTPSHIRTPPPPTPCASQTGEKVSIAEMISERMSLVMDGGGGGGGGRRGRGKGREVGERGGRNQILITRQGFMRGWRKFAIKFEDYLF